MGGRNFNTSYVMVQPNNHITPYLIDINFNTSYVMVQQIWSTSTTSSPSFQYILCYGSTIAGM